LRFTWRVPFSSLQYCKAAPIEEVLVLRFHKKMDCTRIALSQEMVESYSNVQDQVQDLRVRYALQKEGKRVLEESNIDLSWQYWSYLPGEAIAFEVVRFHVLKS
jgi:hypothetical protein